LSLAGAFSPASKAMIALYPAGAFLLAIFAYKRWKPAYAGLVCWLWFFSPFIRRVVDWKAGGNSSPILLASFLAAAVPGLFLVGDWSGLLSKRTGPMLFVFGGIFYGSVIALTHFRFFGLAQALLAYVSPILFAFFLYAERNRYREIYKGFEFAFLSATIVTGVYGIYQFLYLTPWDTTWMLNADLESIGLPEPMLVRVFGTMNAPQVFAAFMMCGVILAFRSQTRLRFLAGPIGFAALVLTMARSSWLALVAGLIYLCFYLTNKQRLQLMGAILLCGALGVAAMQNSGISEVVNKRVQSLSSGKGDDSVSTRIADYGTLWHMMANEPFGLGLGDDAAGANSEGAASTSNGGIASRDSTITTVLLSMGWIGSAAFAVGTLFLCFDIFVGVGRGPDESLLTPLRAILIGLICEVPLNNISAGPVAFLVWCCIGFCLAQKEVASASIAGSTRRIRHGLPRSVAATG